MTIINDYHTPEHRLQPAGGKIICLDCQRKHDIEEAIRAHEREGITLPAFKNDEDKDTWYEKFMAEAKGQGMEEPW